MSVKWRKTSVKARREARDYAQQREDAAAIGFAGAKDLTALNAPFKESTILSAAAMKFLSPLSLALYR